MPVKLKLVIVLGLFCFLSGCAGTGLNAANQGPSAEEIEKTAFEHYLNGWQALKKGHFDRAVSLFNQAIELKPDFSEAFARRGTALQMKGDVRRAMADYEHAIKLDPNNHHAYFHLARILACHPDPKIRNGAEALRLANIAATMKLENIIYIDTLAAAFAEMGDFDRAIRIQDQALDLYFQNDTPSQTIYYDLLIRHRRYEIQQAWREKHIKLVWLFWEEPLRKDIPGL